MVLCPFKHVWFDTNIDAIIWVEGLGPVVQSIVSLMSSLRGQLVKCFTTLLSNILTFLLKKCEKLLHSHIFQQKILAYFRY